MPAHPFLPGGSVLFTPQMCVQAVAVRNEREVRAPLMHPSVREHQDFVGVHDCGQAMGDEDRRPVFGDASEGAKNVLQCNDNRN